MDSKFALFLIAAAASAQPGPPVMGDGIWLRNAAFGELETFDLCNGHQPGSGMYHHHVNPVCLRAQLNDNVVTVATGRLGTQYTEKTGGWTHSPILGWAYDGYPVYGPYGYANPADAKSAVQRMRPGFRLRPIAQRHSLPDWVLPYLPNVSQNLTAAQYGPDVDAKFPLGRYVPDYEFVEGIGDLDRYNGRFTVTPEFPSGTYAYFVTIAEDGSPAFPYIVNVQYYGVGANGSAPTVPGDAVDYFNNGKLAQAPSSDPQLATWFTRNSALFAQAITGFDPSAGPSTTWPLDKPAGVTVSGGNAAPALADVQRIRYNGGNVYVNSNNLPSYVIGPWFDATMTGGVFMNWAASTAQQVKVTRTPAPAATKAATGMGPVGVWVNGVAIFNTLDGGSYSNAAGDDRGGGGVAGHATHVSSASTERGPLAAGSIVSAYAQFNASFGSATNTATAGASDWPTSLGGVSVTVSDSTGAQLPAGILYVSPGQVNYRIPANAAAGFGKVTIYPGGISGNVNVAPTYPGIYKQDAGGLAAGQILRVHNGTQSYEAISKAPVVMGSDQLYLILYGTGIGTAAVTASMAGSSATVTYSGPQGTYPGLDQINILLPSTLTGKGQVETVITAGGKPANPVYFLVQ